MKYFNINETVRVRLTDVGRAILAAELERKIRAQLAAAMKAVG